MHARKHGYHIRTRAHRHMQFSQPLTNRMHQHKTDKAKVDNLMMRRSLSLYFCVPNSHTRALPGMFGTPAGTSHSPLRARDMHEDMDQQASSMIACVLTQHYTALLPACMKTWTKRQARLAVEHHCRRALPSRARALALSRACACSLRHLPPVPAHSGARPDGRGRWLVVVRIWIARTFSTSAAPI